MKNRSTPATLFLAAISLILLSCSSSVSASSETRNVNQDFFGIILNGNANVYIAQGDQNEIRIEGLEQNTREVSTVVSNGALVINAGVLRNVSVYVTMTDINLLQVNGSGMIRATTPLNSDMLLLKITGSGVISADVRALSVGMIINGGGKIYANGIAGDSYIKVKGSGQVVSMNLDSLRESAYVENLTVQQSSLKRKSHRGLSLHQ
jgi:hypothetical protein